MVCFEFRKISLQITYNIFQLQGIHPPARDPFQVPMGAAALPQGPPMMPLQGLVPLNRVLLGAQGQQGLGQQGLGGQHQDQDAVPR